MRSAMVRQELTLQGEMTNSDSDKFTVFVPRDSAVGMLNFTQDANLDNVRLQVQEPFL